MIHGVKKIIFPINSCLDYQTVLNIDKYDHHIILTQQNKIISSIHESEKNNYRIIF
jgi:hypothetical protein